MFTHRNTKLVLQHIHRATGQLISVEKMMLQNQPLISVHTQLLAATKSASSCYDNTFRTFLAEQLAITLSFRMKTPGIAPQEFYALRTTARNISALSTAQIFLLLMQYKIA